ncbi:Uncharacterised protein [Mycobacteroides abscessus subsp. abscessus]|nr:Uncharacterised protein [Mycobacteroides abscessus subsp. abscessus]
MPSLTDQFLGSDGLQIVEEGQRFLRGGPMLQREKIRRRCHDLSLRPTAPTRPGKITPK